MVYLFRYILFLCKSKNIYMIPNSGLAVHVLSNGIISLWAQLKRAFLVMSEISHVFFCGATGKMGRRLPHC
jgi:hypothetical protein